MKNFVLILIGAILLGALSYIGMQCNHIVKLENEIDVLDNSIAKMEHERDSLINAKECDTVKIISQKNGNITFKHSNVKAVNHKFIVQ